MAWVQCIYIYQVNNNSDEKLLFFSGFRAGNVESESAGLRESDRGAQQSTDTGMGPGSKG